MKPYYRRNLPHIQKFLAAYFVTFRTIEDLYLSPAARSIALKHCRFEHGRRVELHAVVIMPTHVHLLFTPEENDYAEPFSLAEIMKGIKGTSAYNINKMLRRKGQLWQDESFDRVMRLNEFDRKLSYIETNPVDAGLCKKPSEYRWLWVQPISERMIQTGISR